MQALLKRIIFSVSNNLLLAPFSAHYSTITSKSRIFFVKVEILCPDTIYSLADVELKELSVQFFLKFTQKLAALSLILFTAVACHSGEVPGSYPQPAPGAVQGATVGGVTGAAVAGFNGGSFPVGIAIGA